MKSLITDREIQLAEQRAYGADDRQLVEMLRQLLDFRECGRTAVAEHDFRIYHNGGISQMRTLINQSGCQWWNCGRPAQTAHARHAYTHWLCRLHADEGEAQGIWSATSRNIRLKQEDGDARAWDAKRAAEVKADAPT